MLLEPRRSAGQLAPLKHDGAAQLAPLDGAGALLELLGALDVVAAQLRTLAELQAWAGGGAVP